MVDNVKEKSAFALMTMFKILFEQPDEIIVQSLCGLMTAGEMEDFLKRDIVREEITRSMAATGSMTVSKIADQCECSKELVRRVWDAMCKEYPPTTTQASTLRVALASETRPQNHINDQFARAGFRVEIKDKRNKSGVIVDIRNGLPPIPCRLIAGQDIPKFMEGKNPYQLAIVGNDKLNEHSSLAKLSGRESVKLTKLYGFDRKTFRLRLAVPNAQCAEARAKGLAYFSGKVVATSYPAVLCDYMDSKGIAIRDVIPLKGGVEQAMTELKADAILDIVETGNSLKVNQLSAVGRSLLDGEMSIVAPFKAVRPISKEPVLDGFVKRLKAA